MKKNRLYIIAFLLFALMCGETDIQGAKGLLIQITWTSATMYLLAKTLKRIEVTK